jgi:hypothetical protein
MSYRLLRRTVTVGVLAAVLLSATPAHARDLGTAGSVWGWMQEVWGRGVAALWDREVVPTRRPGENQRKEGWGLDPNGATTPRSSSTPTACSSCSEEGDGLDPNG